jgi:hypothetical protein
MEDAPGDMTVACRKAVKLHVSLLGCHLSAGIRRLRI